jgi:hypothetical protein
MTQEEAADAVRLQEALRRLDRLEAELDNVESELTEVKKKFVDLQNLKVGAKAVLWVVGGLGGAILFALTVYDRVSK